MAERPRLICAGSDLRDGGAGVRFSVGRGGAQRPAFVVRFRGRVHAYLNQCAHAGLELDWMPGEFFDASGLYLICSAHGAHYEPGSGCCAGGPCRGGGLIPLPVEERDGRVLLRETSSDE